MRNSGLRVDMLPRSDSDTFYNSSIWIEAQVSAFPLSGGSLDLLWATEDSQAPPYELSAFQ